jgi:hypothetical protein
MRVCATLISTAMQLQEKISKENIKRKQSQSRYISRMRWGVLIQPIAMEVCLVVQDTIVINPAILVVVG